jgi:hypothetical protein
MLGFGWPYSEKPKPEPKPFVDPHVAVHTQLAFLDKPIKSLKANPWDQAVEKLIKQTRSGELVWAQSLHVVTTDRVPGLIYVTKTLGRDLAAYIYQYKDYTNEFDYEWDSFATVRFMTDNVCTSRWQTRNNASVFILFHAIEEQLIGTETFLKEYLK